ncbi:MAG: transglutaminase-like cysteine peptidase [Alphaproteobacteria bacterium]|nr:transglutaminase-like cysteine peptidase [Alphaproteobacteria bacterium]
MQPISFRFRIIFVLTCVVCFAVAERADAGVSYFDMSEDISSNLKPFPKWTSVMSRYRGQQKTPDSECGKTAFHPCVIPQWKSLVAGLRDESMENKLEAINDWANAHPYIVDQLNWGLNDYWSTPYEFMEVNGDCEDYAIAKYYSLRAAGVPEDRLRIMVVQDLNLGGIIHAILGVYDDDKLWILDNQIKQVVDAYSIYHYRPIYGANGQHWWRYYPKN